MGQHISKGLRLTRLTLMICCTLYPLVLWAVGRTVIPFHAACSIVTEPDGPDWVSADCSTLYQG